MLDSKDKLGGSSVSMWDFTLLTYAHPRRILCNRLSGGDPGGQTTLARRRSALMLFFESFECACCRIQGVRLSLEVDGSGL